MIYITEIPHQRPPSTWCAINEQDAMDRINAWMSGQHIAEEASDYEEAIRMNGSDLYAQYVLTTEEAREALRNGGKYWSPHQREKALSTLRRAMILAGELDHTEIRVQVFKIWEDGQEFFYVEANSMPEALDQAAQRLGAIDYSDLAQDRGWGESDGLNIELVEA